MISYRHPYQSLMNFQGFTFGAQNYYTNYIEEDKVRNTVIPTRIAYDASLVQRPSFTELIPVYKSSSPKNESEKSRPQKRKLFTIDSILDKDGKKEQEEGRANKRIRKDSDEFSLPERKVEDGRSRDSGISSTGSVDSDTSNNESETNSIEVYDEKSISSSPITRTSPIQRLDGKFHHASPFLPPPSINRQQLPTLPSAIYRGHNPSPIPMRFGIPNLHSTPEMRHRPMPSFPCDIRAIPMNHHTLGEGKHTAFLFSNGMQIPLSNAPTAVIEEKNKANRKSKRLRTVFTPDQLEQMEDEFSKQHYLVGTDRFHLAKKLNLAETQVKVWFQNRRIKWRKQKLEMNKDCDRDSESDQSNQSS
uniref:homeobox protein vab-15-like n=1 Tax=Styela clava TaxID=7725 RepID=UPI00193A7905|nr:homeobox protein vab-15-like [Styela clava]